MSLDVPGCSFFIVFLRRKIKTIATCTVIHLVMTAEDSIPDPDTWGGNRSKTKGYGKGKSQLVKEGLQSKLLAMLAYACHVPTIFKANCTTEEIHQIRADKMVKVTRHPKGCWFHLISQFLSWDSQAASMLYNPASLDCQVSIFAKPRNLMLCPKSMKFKRVFRWGM